MRTKVFISVLLAATLLAVPLSAQLPQATDEERAAGARVATIEFDHSPVDILIGDTIQITARLLDIDGSLVEGARFVLAGFQTSVAGVRPVDGSTTVFNIWGREPGDGEFFVGLILPPDMSRDFGVPGLKQMPSLAIHVEDYPAATIVIDEPEFTPYAGTSFKLSGHVMNTEGREHASATIEWRSNNPDIAMISSGGVLTLEGPGRVELLASTENDVSATYGFEVVENPVEQLSIMPRMASTRRGDVLQFDVRALDGRGRAIDDIAMSYSVFGLDSAGAEIFDDGRFVADNEGSYRVIVTAGPLAAQAVVEVEGRPAATPVRLLDRGPRAEVATSDLWVFEGTDGRDYAYTGTHAQGGGQRMFVWDVTDPNNIELRDSVVVDARVVNDVKVNGDATWAVITREGASTRANGLVVLSLEDPAHPEVIAELTENLTSGVHNVWINGDVVYVVNDGTNAMDIVDLSDPYNPRYHGRWELRPGETDKNLHDVWADGRYAYLSYWDDGLVILDVGAGTHGGTALDPAFVSQIYYDQGNTHVAWREGDYVFLGDEIGTQFGMRGYIHVIDVSNIDHPAEVAKYEVPEAGTHNIWVENGMLYIAYYQGGLRVVDITGELRGDLYRQGREVGKFLTSGSEGEAVVPNSPMAWGPQPFKGNIFISDMNSGLWVVKHERPTDLSP
ncbi:MAG: LVIVD repeat-containing protein [Gemmatimonadales bacterium]